MRIPLLDTLVRRRHGGIALPADSGASSATTPAAPSAWLGPAPKRPQPGAVSRVRIGEALVAQLGERRVFLRPMFDFGNALGKVVPLANPVWVEAYARVPENALSWDAAVRVGAFSYLTPGSQMAGCDIGRHCSIAAGAHVMSANHPMDRASTSTWSYGHRVLEVVKQDFGVTIAQRRDLPPPARTTIGHDVWVGEMATIKRGITLHTGCVVGANAVVTRDVPPYAVVAGNPARIIKHRFDEAVVTELLASHWWDLHPAQLATLDMCDPVAFAREAGRLVADHPADYAVEDLLALFQAHGDVVG